jgi:hypothetical protein
VAVGGHLALLLSLSASVSACSFSVDYAGAHYACEPPDGECPSGSTCGPGGFCVPVGGGDPIDAAVPPTDAPDDPGPDAEPGQPDAAVVPGIDAGLPFTVAFGERLGSDVSGVTFDTDLNSTATSDNNGGFTDIFVGFSDAGDRSSGLLRFDLSAVPPGTTVQGATLELFTRGDSLNVGDMQLFRVLEAWDEGDQTADPGVANFNQRKPGLSWLSAGAFPPSSNAAPLAQFSPNATDQAFQVSLPANVVQAWVNDPASNFGLMLFVTEQGADVSFDSSESSNDNRRPELRVTFVP